MISNGDRMVLTLSHIASVLGADLTGEDCAFSGISINTRTMSEGDLFIAIKGENFDAHDYLAQAKEKGACAVVVERTTAIVLPQLRVKNTRIAFGMIASLWRDSFSLPVVAITGSCGKTSVKEMTAAIFRQQKKSVLSTKGNLNNDIGVPLTLMQINNEHKMAVIEIGANHRGEIKQLVSYVKPDVAVITNVLHAHIEGFGSIDGVAKAKAEIYSGLGNKNSEAEAVAVINADDAFADYWQQYCQELAENKEKAIKTLTFGLDKPADISADYHSLAFGLEVTIKTPQGNKLINLKQFGKHNVSNALAATALALSSGCTLEQIKTGLESFTNASGRLELKEGIEDCVIFDDTYNANPGSVRAGIDAIQQLEGDAILILGDMAELGDESEKLHYQLGIDAANLGIKQLFTVGITTNETCKGFNSVNAKANNALHFSTKEKLVHQVSDYLHQASKENNECRRKVILVKGSRTMEMESVVQALLKENSHSENSNTIKKGVH